jgi:hypothetical protein
MSNTYTVTQFKNDLFNAMITRNPIYSGRGLGNSSNINLWNDKKVQSFYNGVLTAHKLFFSNELSLINYARLMICESMQESTGDYNLGVKKVDFNDHTSHGIIQVTPGSVLIDYYNYGKPIVDINDDFILNPADVLNLDLSDPGVCIVIWALYTKNSVLMGMSFNEYINRIKWHSTPSNVTKDVGNCLFNWLGGPRNDRHANNSPFDDYYKRILDYYVCSGFGTKAEFDSILDTKLNDKIFGIYDIHDCKINNRDTVISAILPI